MVQLIYARVVNPLRRHFSTCYFVRILGWPIAVSSSLTNYSIPFTTRTAPRKLLTLCVMVLSAGNLKARQLVRHWQANWVASQPSSPQPSMKNSTP